MIVHAICTCAPYIWAICRAAVTDLDGRAMVLYARQMKRTIAALTLALSTTACPKPQPDPVPADCTKPGQACADDPHTEGPPPVGTLDPPK